MKFYFTIVFVLFVAWKVGGQHKYFYPGDFCSSRIPQCCNDRDDNCTAPSPKPRCYCDDFCDQHDVPDCCPDYKRVCRGVKHPETKTLDSKRCRYKGEEYKLGDIVKINCKECKCTLRPGSQSHAKMQCQKKRCLIDLGLIEDINNGLYDWTAGNYSEFWGRTLQDGFKYRLGTLDPRRSINSAKILAQSYRSGFFPSYFTVSQKWHNLISGIRDQGWCGASWAFSTVAVAADRLSIASDGDQVAELSPQYLVSCNGRKQRGCRGGHLGSAWKFLRRFGTVEEVCYRYVSGEDGKPGSCGINRRNPYKDLECPMHNEVTYDGNRSPRRVGRAYRIENKEEDIMNEIYTHGPVQATMRVDPDFFMYRRGVYHPSNIRKRKNPKWHSVRLLGWGEENGKKYWLAMNSWGKNWGEGGSFKIRRGRNDCDIESYVMAAAGTK